MEGKIRQLLSAGFQLIGRLLAFVLATSGAYAAERGIELTRAPEAWAKGWTGAGVTVGIISSGVRRTHEALRDGFVGLNGWSDPYDSSPEPMDRNGDGTHLAGIVVGRSGIGMAPGAKWMACKSTDTAGSAAMFAVLECLQFMLCPTDTKGENPDCSKGPRVVVIDRPVSGTWMDDSLQAMETAGILFIAPTGDGPDCGGSCGVVVSPSSRRTTSDVVAPGQNIRSAFHTSDTSYLMLNGFQLAAAHVAGTAALMLSANPNLTPTQLREGLLKASMCEGGTDCDGSLDALKAVEAAASMR